MRDLCSIQVEEDTTNYYPHAPSDPHPKHLGGKKVMTDSIALDLGFPLQKVLRFDAATCEFELTCMVFGHTVPEP
jgi:hypothetical protein